MRNSMLHLIDARIALNAAHRAAVKEGDRALASALLARVDSVNMLLEALNPRPCARPLTTATDFDVAGTVPFLPLDTEGRD